MDIVTGHQHLPPLRHPVAVALGNFDGIHIGHQKLLATAVDIAAQTNGQALAFTLDPHPAHILPRRQPPQLITSNKRKFELMANIGIEICVVEPFTKTLSLLSPDDFLDTVLVQSLRAQHIIVGHNFGYGHKRQGDVVHLLSFGKKHKLDIHVIHPIQTMNKKVSSTTTRQVVSQGNLDLAHSLLGRPFDMDGVVIKGKKLGRTLGFPTANLAIESDRLTPPHGVYAVHIKYQEKLYSGIANLGVCPTLTSKSMPSLEVHIFDFNKDLYDQHICIIFKSLIRKEIKFDSIEALQQQIKQDCLEAREKLQS